MESFGKIHVQNRNIVWDRPSVRKLAYYIAERNFSKF